MGPTTRAPPLLNLIATLLTFSSHSPLLRFLHRLITSFFLFLLSSFNAISNTHLPKTPKVEIFNQPNNDSGLSRTLSQLLSIVNDIPVSSRKYEIVRSFVERIVDDNNRQGFESLKEVNRIALTTSFERTLRRLENAAVAEERGDVGFGFGLLPAEFYHLSRALKALRYVVDVTLARVVNVNAKSVVKEEKSGCGLGEKFAAEALWLAKKLAECGYVEEAVEQWASASRLAWISLRVEPRLQGAMVKVATFLFKKMGEIERDGKGLELDDERKLERKIILMKMLVLWLPLLCRASNGVDAPVLSVMERVELERILEEMIDGLECIEDQEKVLSLWLHHFTYCSSSDWPNLNKCYARWCNESRKQLLLD